MTGLRMTPEQKQIHDSVKSLCDRFDDEYWLQCDLDHRWPVEYHNAMKEAGWMGITIPQEYGGAGLGVTEAALMMQVVGNSAGAIAACSTIQAGVFGPHAVTVHGNESQKARILPRLASGQDQAAFGVTEPDADSIPRTFRRAR